MNVKPKKLAVTGVAVAAVLIIFSTTGYMQSTSAQQLPIISELPAGTNGILTVKSLVINEKVSKNRDIEMTAESQDSSLIFKAINKANKDSHLGVDAWKISIDGAVLDINPLPISGDSASLEATESTVVRVFNLNDYFSEFEEYPGIYDVTLLGFDREYSFAKAQEYADSDSEFVAEDLAKYKVKATMIVGYDENVVKAKGHLLKAKNTQVAIDGLNPFVITDNENRNVTLSIINNESYPVSSLVSYLSYSVMNTELTKVAGAERFAGLEESCLFLMPGESKVIFTIPLGKDIAPLGGNNSLATIIGEGNSAKTGTYIVEIQGATKPCSIDGEDMPGMFFESMIAFEVI